MSETISESDVPPAKRMKTESVMEDATEDSKEADVTEEAVGKKQANTSEDPKYTNFVTPEELEKLKEFKVLDEVRSNDEDSNDDSDSSDGKSEVPEEEIEKMLEEDLPDGFKGAPQPKQKPYVTIQKIVLEEKGVNHFEVLPLDWMVVRHYSGMPVYIHRTTRVCTLSKPYFLGKGNTRRHDIPISAIPCLAYRRALEEERKQQIIDRKIEEQIKNGTWGKNIMNQKPTENGAASNSNGEKTEETDKDKTNLNKDTTNDKSSSKIADNVTEIEQVSNAGENDTSNGESENTSIDKLKDKSSQHNESKFDDNNVTESCEVIELRNDKGDTKATRKCPFLHSNSVGNAEAKTESVSGVLEKSTEDVEMVDLSNNKDAESNKNMQECVNDTECSKNMKESDQDGESINHTQEADKKAESNDQGGNVEGNSDANKADDKSFDDIEIPKYRQPVILPGGTVMPAPKVETINNSWKTQHLSHEQVNEYCKKLFKFKIVNIMHFNRWADRRKYNKARKTLQYPTLPDGTKLITIPARPNGQDNGKPAKRDWVMNMDGRSSLSVFHEYVRRALQEQPVYEFVQLENAATPYQATVYIGGMQYGVGHGSSKRQAKAAAARASIHILIPEMKDELDAPANKEPDFSFFDYVGIEDPHISEFCAATCEPSPHAILRTCLLRNFGASDRHIQTEMKKLEFQKIELTMKVGKHTATVVCKNKKTAKQRASQAILQALHPHVRSWGSLLRLYGSRSVKSFKEKKLEEQQITLLQDRARHNQPNRAVLDKLRRDMLRLKERDAACVPIGTLLLKDDLPTHSGSNLNNVDL